MTIPIGSCGSFCWRRFGMALLSLREGCASRSLAAPRPNATSVPLLQHWEGVVRGFSRKTNPLAESNRHVLNEAPVSVRHALAFHAPWPFAPLGRRAPGPSRPWAVRAPGPSRPRAVAPLGRRALGPSRPWAAAPSRPSAVRASLTLPTFSPEKSDFLRHHAQQKRPTHDTVRAALP